VGFTLWILGYSIFLELLQHDGDQHAHELCGRRHSTTFESHLRVDKELLLKSLAMNSIKKEVGVDVVAKSFLLNIGFYHKVIFVLLLIL
jgi:hypothetical protein